MVALARKPWYLGATPLDKATTGPIEYLARELRMVPDALAAAVGVCGPDDFRVVPRRAGATISDVDILATGANAILKGTAGQGKYVQPSDGDIALSGFSAPSSGTRVYLVYQQIHDKQSNQGADYQSSVEFTSGTTLPGTPPGITLPLAQITIAAGQLSIQAQHIKDLRPQAMGLPSLAAHVEFYGGNSQHLDRRTAALYAPDGIRNVRGFTVGAGKNIPNPQQASLTVPWSGKWGVDAVLAANAPAYSGDNLTTAVAAITRTSSTLGVARVRAPGGMDASSVPGKLVLANPAGSLACMRGDQLQCHFAYDGPWADSNLNNLAAELHFAVYYLGPLPDLY